jgi:hypothetical protein
VLLVPRKDADANRGAGLESEGAGMSDTGGGEAGTVGPHMALNVSIRSSSSNTNINEVGRDSNGGYSSPTAERPIEHGINTTLNYSLFYYTAYHVDWPLPLPLSLAERRRQLSLFHKHSVFPLELCCWGFGCQTKELVPPTALNVIKSIERTGSR